MLPTYLGTRAKVGETNPACVDCLEVVARRLWRVHAVVDDLHAMHGSHYNYHDATFPHYISYMFFFVVYF